MKERCLNPNHVYYRNYGGRGIKVCDRWRDSFTAFLADMGRRPSLKHSLDRIDNDGDYVPGNCRWATRKEQARNSRHARVLEIHGVRMTVTEWAAQVGIKPQVIFNRLKRGAIPHRAVFEPPGLNARGSSIPFAIYP